MASPRNFPPHSRTESAFSQTSNADSLAAPANPFKTPPASYPGSVIIFGSSYQPSGVSGERFFRSRRIRKDWNASPPKFKKEPKEKWLTIIPLSGIGIGTVITGLLIFLQVGLKKSYNYCSVLDDDFSTGILNPSIWTKEVNVGGFGYVKKNSVLKGFQLTTVAATNSLRKLLALMKMPSSKMDNFTSSQLSKMNLSSLPTRS
jgi:hypothetical protein